MKLQKQKVSIYKNKIYYKYAILVPNKLINSLGWDEVKELKVDSVIGKGLFLFPE